MKTKSLLIIAIAALLAIAALWWMGADRNSPLERTSTGLLFEGLSANINDIGQIKLRDAAGEIATIVKDDDFWRVAELNNYPADTGKLREFVLALGNARILETKTSNPEFYERLGVRDIDQEGSAAVQVELVHGDQSYDVLIGNDAPRANGAAYVRKTGEPTTLLVDAALDASAVPAEWLNKTILDVAAASVQSVQILGNGGRSKIAKSDRTQTEYAFSPPQDKSLNTADANVLSRALAGLTLQRVVPAAEFEADAYDARDFTFVLFDGVIVDAKVFSANAENQDDTTTWFSASARFDADLAQSLMPQPGSESNDGADEASEVTEEVATEFALTATDLAVRQQQADVINQRLRGWIYNISRQRYDRFKTAEQLINAE